MAVHRFEDLIAWQRARTLAGQVYAATRAEPFARDFGLKDQLQRASVSVMANIAEGFERHRQAEFARFLDIAEGSLAEVLSQLYLASDVGYLSSDEFECLAESVDGTGKVIAGLRRSLTPNSHRGPATGDRQPS